MEALIDPLRPAAYQVYWPGTNLGVPAGRAFTYVIAGNGLFKFAMHACFDARVRLASWKRPLPGLRSLDSGMWMASRIPAAFLDDALAHARRVAWDNPVEQMYQVVIHRGRMRLQRPVQQATADHIRYEAERPDRQVIMDLHSHCQMDSYFSQTDDRDEGGLRLYGVMGRIYNPRADLRLRVGVYGDFASVPASVVFDGPVRLRDLTRERE